MPGSGEKKPTSFSGPTYRVQPSDIDDDFEHALRGETIGVDPDSNLAYESAVPKTNTESANPGGTNTSGQAIKKLREKIKLSDAVLPVIDNPHTPIAPPAEALAILEDRRTQAEFKKARRDGREKTWWGKILNKFQK